MNFIYRVLVSGTDASYSLLNKLISLNRLSGLMKFEICSIVVLLFL